MPAFLLRQDYEEQAEGMTLEKLRCFPLLPRKVVYRENDKKNTRHYRAKTLKALELTFSGLMQDRPNLASPQHRDNYPASYPVAKCE